MLIFRPLMKLGYFCVMIHRVGIRFLITVIPKFPKFAPKLWFIKL